MELSFREFLDQMTADPFTFLQLHSLVQFQRDGGRLEPGQLLAAYPPFITKESANGVLLRAVCAAERMEFLANFARQLSAIDESQHIRIAVTE